MTALAPPFSALLSSGTDDGREADPRFREVMRLVAEPVVVITGADAAGEPAGLTVSSFASVSLAPPLVLFCADHRSNTWSRIAATGRFAVNILGAANADLAARFATRFDRPADRFSGVHYRVATDGTPLLDGVLATASCRVRHVHPAGDHDVVIGTVLGTTVVGSGPPLTYHRRAYSTVSPL